jgi:hypothetical protein
MSGKARVALAELMRIEQHQATMVNWLLGADHCLGYLQLGAWHRAEVRVN